MRFRSSTVVKSMAMRPLRAPRVIFTAVSRRLVSAVA